VLALACFAVAVLAFVAIAITYIFPGPAIEMVVVYPCDWLATFIMWFRPLIASGEFVIAAASQ